MKFLRLIYIIILVFLLELIYFIIIIKEQEIKIILLKNFN